MTDSSSRPNIKVKSKNNRISDDPRFAHVRKDPRFVRPKKKDVKIALDDRFAHMLTSEEFSDALKVDKYGKPISSDKADKGLKRYYNLKEDDEFLFKSESSKTINIEDQATTEEETDEENFDLSTLDFARGEGVLESSSDDEEEYVYSKNNNSVEQQGSSESDEQVPLGDETHRLAVVNLDWDNVKASDLMKVFSGFIPDGSIIFSVKIYPSEFGKERMEKETREGPPKEIFKSTSASSDRDDEEINLNDHIINDNGEEFDSEALRKYQLERLRYYYAVVDCDTVETARHIYQQCDGAEFESTSNSFDLRFIPDDLEFNDELKDECFQAPDMYEPVDFVTDALQYSSVKLTWDGDDPDRVKTIRQTLSKKNIDDMDFKNYIASSSEESGDDIEETRRKYKNLLYEIENENAETDQEMEITFTPGLSEVAAVNSEKAIENETSLETYLRKQREKRKEKKNAKEKQMENTSDDDNVGRNSNNLHLINSNISKPKSKKPHKFSKEEHKEADRQKAELELLVMDDEKEVHKHFDLKEIIKNEKRKNKKKKIKKDSIQDDDDFEINVNDSRFAALHESHHFAIDPSNPQFKKTKSMGKLLEERQRRQSEPSQQKSNTAFEEISNDKDPNIKDSNLSLLVNSVSFLTINKYYFITKQYY
ncbi:hypothetical protein GLOIN_2v1527562 [Rhizophagus irregularis DAOM 181602=DAOM 197198]|uniref:Uncharacterized protein n=1 Tax=Rhizophagus irregularis (strain DAOM 181602 / DAOM 197198 / MUCL 43194) TaxID=747089 RepID=A0A2P4QP75_RHIID|nr:hypothetical protein GLOIN_2v1527562 [Rhizophagus irregularis DAOM 181602=DAOM 197198]POG79424.1 hypothetical protein GLOIN_2v1527562 [Rhizophagus irregularis DAOM 181602=DAOM 197198]|eukprot:XP_025186290.1 hypothetical protein GLOIN_2v1527562 [Rhizophagus irregularis DAOM 181602=DAOM 197198]